MTDNLEIAAAFKLLSQLMELHGANTFKARAYAGAAFKIERETKPLAGRDLDQLSIPGIGMAITQKIKELLHTGQLSLLEEYLAKTPPGVLRLLSLKGIGPKKIGMLWRELGIESIGELAYACQENRLLALKGFGAKTQELLLQNIAFLQEHDGYYLFAAVDQPVNLLQESLVTAFPQHRTEVAGAFRRQCPILNQIEWVTTIPLSQLQEYFLQEGKGAIATGEPALKVKFEETPEYIFHPATEADFPASLFVRTNSLAFNKAFSNSCRMPEKATSETDIFRENGLDFIPPPLREEGGIIARWRNTEPKTPLIQTGDIRGIIHAHSHYSDGKNSLEEMARGAIEKGYEYLVISDHSQAAAYANGLTPDTVKKQQQAIDLLNEQLFPFRIFKGIEADILGDGALDYDETTLATFDLVIASIHSNLKMTEEKAMSRLLKAIHNPYTTILGHPTGRLLLSRNGYPIDHKVIIDACAEQGVAIEINAHPRRLDLDWTWIPYAIEKGVWLSIDPDAHSIGGMDLIKYGVLAAQKGALRPENNLSSKSPEALEEWLLQRKQKSGS